MNTLKKEGINAVTLGNNHIMDFGENGLTKTLELLLEAGITTFGAGKDMIDAEKPFVQIINGRRIVYFSAYWYRQTMYREYNYYANGVTPGVACLSGGLIEQVREEKRKNPSSTVIILAHWGIDFEKVQPLQRRYAHVLVDAGADLIIGHGPHMMQEIENINGKWVIYSIGNGIFNSNGEYNIRHVPPYSFIAQIELHNSSNQNDKLKLYPIYSDNKATFWKPVPLADYQFKHLIKIQKSYGSPIDQKNIQYNKDNLGYHLILDI